MYEQHFGFQGMPFSASPADWQFFDSESSAALMPKVLHALQSAAGVAVITGPEGVGKSVLLNHLQATLARQGQAIILPGTSLQSAEDLYTCVRRSVKTQDQQTPNSDTGRWDVVERLQSSAEFWGPVGLLVDDAHLLTSELFFELQFLLEQRSTSQTLCRLLLAGSHALEETLAKPALSGFAQRIRTYAFLQPLRLEESVEYLRHRLSHVGGNLGECFEAEAVESVVEAADGSPRCLDLLADECLILAFREGLDRVSLDTVQAALGDLQHLPHAWNVSVRDDSGAGLDDTASASTSWQSSSDGVIEIGAGPVVETAEVGPDMAATDEPSELTEHQISDDLESGSLDDLPPLGEITSDPWIDDTVETGPSGVSDNPATVDSSVAESERTFDAGYMLAELESVGDPAIDIDADLDQRLLSVAASTQTPHGAEDGHLEAQEILTGFQQWQPAGSWPVCWGHGSALIRQWVELTEPACPQDVLSNSKSAEQNGVSDWKISIPAFDEPTPVWPPDTAGVAPNESISVTDSVETNPDTPLDHTMTPAANAVDDEIVSEQIWETVAETQHVAPAWADGQLLHDLADAGSSENDEVTANESGPKVPVRLRIADVAESETGESRDTADNDAESPVPAPDRMFTLPVALDEVTGDCAPLADSVRELTKELETFHGPASDSSVPAGSIPGPRPTTPAGTPTASLEMTAVSEESAEDDVELIHPRLLKQARQIVTTAVPVRQLRSAAGAENSVIPEEQSPALSVTGWDDDDDSDVVPLDDSASETQAPNSGFRNLFTRLRGQR